MADPESERERIRERKRQRLLEQESDGATDAGSPTEPVHLDGDDLDSFVAEHGVVLVDFHADWCGPCQMLDPIVAGVAKETDAAMLKVDIDRRQDLAASHNVQGVPTLVLYADGEPVQRLVGMQEQSRLVELVRRYASGD